MRYEKYVGSYGVRFSRRQKQRFAEELKKDMQEAGYGDCTLIKGRKLLSRAEDLFFGNMKMMRTVIVVPYDTPERRLWHKVLYYPQHGTRNANKNMLATFAPIVIIYLLLLIGLWGIERIVTTPKIAVFASFVMFLLVLLLLYMMVHGVANRHNANRNTIALAKAVALAARLDRDEKRRVAFLFTDKNKSAHLGASVAQKEFAKAGKNPNIICLDCIGRGSIVQIGCNPQNRKLGNELAQHAGKRIKKPSTIKLEDTMRIQNMMNNFRNAVIISAGEKDKDGHLFVAQTATGKDREVSQAQADNIIDMVYGYLHAQK